MIRIAEGVWPNEVKESEFFTSRGEYRVDDQATDVMKNSLLYKMSYHGFERLFPSGQATDRVRNVKLPAKGPELNTLEEAFTSENWIVRIYKVKPLDNIGRDHAAASAFDTGKKKTKRGKAAKAARKLRVV